MGLSDIAKKMLLAVGCALPLLVAGAAVWYRSWAFLPFACGALLGTAAGAGKVLLLERAVKKISAMDDPAQAGNYARLQSLLRLAITGATLLIPAIAIRFGLPAGALWGAAAAVLVYQLAIYSMKFFAKKQ